MPETFRRRSSSCLVIDCGPGVKNGIKKGVVVLVDSQFSERKHSLFPDGTEEGEEDFICQDDKIFAIYRNKKIIPLGQKILVKRHTNERSEKGIVVAAEGQQATDQSHRVTVTMFGILPRGLRKNKKTPYRWRLNIGIGDVCELGPWSENWIEVGLDQDYFLIVGENDLMYRHEHE